MSRTQPSILLVEDEESFVDALAVGLEREGFVVEVERDGAVAVQHFDDMRPDLVLLDLMLPHLSGLDVCREIRNHSRVPIIIVTARSTELDTVVGFEVGADGYVAKPFRLRELVARIRAVLRRTQGDQDPLPRVSEDVLDVAGVRLDLARHEVTVQGNEVKLPLKEFELLELLLDNAGRVLTRETLIDRIWGRNYVGDTKTLDVHVKRIRARIEEDPSNPALLTTIRGLGYRFESGRRR